MNLRPSRIRSVPKPVKELPQAIIAVDGKLTLFLPIPNRAVSPNAQRGQSKKAAINKSKKVKAHRFRAKVAMKNAMVLFDFDPALPRFTGYSLAFFFSTTRFRDDDNADASCKAYRDGIAEALGMDDRNLRKCALSTHAKDAAMPRVEFTLHP